jgi:hypothetical protein
MLADCGDELSAEVRRESFFSSVAIELAAACALSVRAVSDEPDTLFWVEVEPGRL